MKCSKCRCREPAEGKKCCQHCIDYKREYYKKNSEKLLEYQKKYYLDNGENVSEYRKRRYKERTDAGFCAHCLVAERMEDGVYCYRCYLLSRHYGRNHRERNREEYNKKRRDRRRMLTEKGLCPTCGKENDNGTYRCYKCHERYLELQAMRRG